MKRLLLAAIVMLSPPVLAKDTCEDVANAAEIIMKGRQYGRPMMELWKLAKGDEAIQGMIKMAYSKPQFRSPEYQERAVKNYKDEWFLFCVTKYGDQ